MGTSARTAQDRAATLPGRDGRTEEFRTFLTVGIPAGFGFAAFQIVLGLAFNDAGPVLAGVATASYILVVHVWTQRTLGRRPIEEVVRGMLLPMFVPIAITGVLQPGVSLLATMLPIAIAMSYLDRRQMRLVTGLAAASAVTITVANDLVPPATNVPEWILLPLHLSGVLAVITLVSILVWQFRNRLQTTTAELAQLVSMSRDLAETADLSEVGDLTARYLVDAVGADECGIVYWERDADRIQLYGYFPADRRATVPPTYDLAHHPLTRRVLGGATITFSDDDAGADPAEIDYLHAIGQRSMMMMPLVARGRVFGAIEATSAQADFFDAGHIAKAAPFAAEAAMALENYRLIDELRRQAFHDALTGLANRTPAPRPARARASRNGPARMPASTRVLFLDLDDFKAVNDNLGHAGGDELLVAVAERLRQVPPAARHGRTPRRRRVRHPARGPARRGRGARRSRGGSSRTSRRPIRIGDSELIVVGTSIGIAFGVPARSHAEELLRNADFAMYRAKLLGKGRFEVFGRASRRGDASGWRCGADSGKPSTASELRVHYQPIVDLATARSLGVEALVRWQPPGRGHAPAGRLHPAGRGDRADPAHRPAGSSSRPAASSGVADAARPAGAVRRGQPVGAPVPGPGPGRPLTAALARPASSRAGSSWRSPSRVLMQTERVATVDG